MREAFLRLRELLQQPETPVDVSTLEDRCHQRLARLIQRGLRTSALGSADLAALVSHVLRREESLSPGFPTWLLVPREAEASVWPRRADWEAASLRVEVDGSHYRISPASWEPSWLPDASGSELTLPLFREDLRRSYEEVAGDPYLSAVGLARFRCDGQREAIRAVLSVPAGCTLLVNLPTGAGKSLCAHLPALLMSERGGTSVVVVPTTTLALDQQRAIERWVPHPTAYIGGQSALDVERRSSIRARIRDGSQRIVFTSPESLVGSLRWALFHAARVGGLRLFVIDEAHMVEQWGDEFRPAFQETAGLRHALQREIPQGARAFTTILLTATMTKSGLATLESLFGRPGPFVVSAASQLRPEPSYWPVRAEHPDEQGAWVLDALRHLPRPLILYVTEPGRAREWAERLLRHGYGRLGVVTGRTSNQDRGRVLGLWQTADIDIVVATSAFGLGVDQADVRAVVHATVPENVDRYYQEVGRGGRDGAACLSLVVYTMQDIERARRLNRKTMIGIRRGRQRWARMFAGRQVLDGDRVCISVDEPPSWNANDMEMDGDFNRAWNVRTLTLMSRAGLLDLDAESPPTRTILPGQVGDRTDDSDGVATAPGSLESLDSHRVVRIRHHGSIDREVWSRDVEPVRQSIRRSGERGFALMLELLRGSRCAGEVLADAYSVSEGGRRTAMDVLPSCGGCVNCRKERRQPYGSPLLTRLPTWPTKASVSEVLGGLVGEDRRMAIYYDSLPPHLLSRLLQWLVGQGVRVVAMPAEDLETSWEVLRRAGADSRWVFAFPLDGFHFMQAPALPTLVHLPQRVPLPGNLRRAFRDSGAPASVRLLLAASNAQDPDRAPRLLRHTLNCNSCTLEELFARIGL